MAKFFVVAAHGLIKKDNKYLVTKRANENDYMPGYWDLPGGSIKFGEKTFLALKREIKQETNLNIKPGKIIYAYGYKSGESRHQFQLIYLCDYLSGVVKLNPSEHSDYRWLTLKELKLLKNKIAFLKELTKEL